jgi:capsular polysaccharide biosynthesis protein
MEIRIFLRLLQLKWWIILSTVFIIVGSTLVVTLNLTPLYSTTVTYAISPSQKVLDDPGFVGGLSVLGAQIAITNTYASVATSASIRENAIEALRLNQQQNRSFDVSSRVQSGTNLIDITVKGSDPLTVLALTNRIGRGTEEYVDSLYEVYDMKIVDSPAAPEKPIWPNLGFNVVMAFTASLVLGISLAFLASLKEF